ncbi:MAG: hypothetical protein Q7R87_04220 [Nanoarchaeota archaeon]|nr:hypothetical protein [Nanoarchaeota archaeon]
MNVKKMRKHNKIKGLSEREVKIVAGLEFNQRYYFITEDIKQFFKNKTQQYNTIKSLLKKKRIIKLNRNKYYLIPIKAKSGGWVESSYILADEMCNSTDYFVGGWAAANYWRLTDQIPMRTDIYTTKRQGRIHILTSDFVFHRTTKERIKKASKQKIKGHQFYILNKKETNKWLKSRN